MSLAKMVTFAAQRKWYVAQKMNFIARWLTLVAQKVTLVAQLGVTSKAQKVTP